MTTLSLFLCGDVMTGRGVDQILPGPCDPALHEPYVKNALDYVALAERRNGPIPRGVDPSYVWGDALEELERFAPDRRIVNLETAVTRCGRWLPKGINYRMSPDNIACLTVAAIDCCALSNNHVLDWGVEGLRETLDTLHRAGLRTAGAGMNRSQAAAAAVLPIPGRGRVLVFSTGTETSGIPPEWAATDEGPGVDFLPELTRESAARLAARVAAARRPGDVVVVSIHWGGNWGYPIAAAETAFARALIDAGAADVVHGHSSHHPKAIEVYRGRLILYGCGDFINDYEGIGGREEYRGDLALAYLPTLETASGRLLRLDLAAMCMRRFRLRRAPPEDTRWLCGVLSREGRRFGTRAVARAGNHIEIDWTRDAAAA